MKILYLMASTGWGGMEKHAFEVAGAMAARGHDVSVLSSDEYAGRCPPGVKFEVFEWGVFRYNPVVWRRLRGLLNRARPDIIHAQAGKATYCLSRAGWPQNTVAIGTVHNIKSGYGAFRRLDAVIAVSRDIATKVGHPHVHVVYNGVNVPAPDPDKVAELRRWLEDKPVPLLLGIGRLVAAKGFDRLLSIWPADRSATLVILGEGGDRSELERIIEERGLRHVYLLGQSSAVSEWISAADLLVISSRNEGGPYVLAEALTMGLPVISTDVGMVPDFLPDSCIVPHDDPAQLQRMLADAVSNPERYRNACVDAVANARSRLSIDAMMNAVEAVYREEIQRKTSGFVKQERA